MGYLREKVYAAAIESYECVPFYLNLARNKNLDVRNTKFEDLPQIKKEDLIYSKFSNINPKYYNESKKLFSVKTSGSTGKCYEILWDYCDEKKSLLPLWLYRKKYYGINTFDRLCYFYPADIEIEESFETKYSKAFSKQCIVENTIEKTYMEIIEYNPIWMILQPSIAIILCQIAEKYNSVPSNLKYIELTGEELSDAARKKIKNVFKCSVANQYGCKEVNSIAYECPEGNMHCMSNNVYVEISEADNLIYVTSFNNHVMPFIRYCTGDRGKFIHNFKCKCGNKNPVLKLLSGRNNDLIIKEDGKTLHSYAITQIVNNINYLYDSVIIQYKIYQISYTEFLFLLVSEEKNLEKTITDIILAKMKERFGESVKVSVRYCENVLPDEKTGKLAVFISKLE